jgi:hypothetical protein
MLPNIGPEFAEALLSRATNKPATHTSPAASQSAPVCKGPDRLASFRFFTLLVLSRILAIVTSKWMVYLILMLILKCL